MQIRCLLVDDEPLALEALAALISKIPMLTISGRCSDAVEAMQWIHNNEVDLMFLDIHMPEISGIGLLKSLSNPPKVIFTTAFRDYAVEAFELDVVDYLVKPVSPERLLKAIDRYRERTRDEESRQPSHPPGMTGFISIYADKKTHRIDPGDILYVEGLKDYAVIVTGTEKLVTRQTMKKMEEMLPEGLFVRVHRSFIVPLAKIRSWSGYAVTIGQKEIPIGKTYRKDVSALLESMKNKY
jgi:DNA-binding LytR/AlgR family response regulator